MTPVTRRTALFTALATPALAQGAWRPERPIRLIVPWTAGGPADTHFRALAGWEGGAASAGAVSPGAQTVKRL